MILLRDRNDTFVLDDPKPGWRELGRLLSHIKSVARLRLESQWMSLPLVSWFYVRQLRRALQDACRIIFVCKGNICRSPFAESCARQVFQGRKDVSSCGYLPVEGRSSPERALRVAREFGIDLRNHSSRVISESAVCESEIILVFDQFDYRTLILQYPFAKKKIFRLGLLSRPGVLNIPDPFGQSEDEHRTVYQEIGEIPSLYAMQ